MNNEQCGGNQNVSSAHIILSNQMLTSNMSIFSLIYKKKYCFVICMKTYWLVNVLILSILVVLQLLRHNTLIPNIKCYCSG